MTNETLSPSAPIATDWQQTTIRLNSISKDCLRQVWAIRDTMQDELTPREMSDMRVKLTGYYSTLISAYNKCDEICTRMWIAQREQYNSDTRTTKVIDATETGILRNKLKNELKAIEKIISALKQRTDLLQGESRNQY